MRQELQSALTQARTLAPEELPRLLGDLEEIRATAVARLSAPVAAPASHDELLEVPEAAHRLGVSTDYLYHNHKKFPFTRRAGRKLLFSARGIAEYVERKSVLTPTRHGAMLATVR